MKALLELIATDIGRPISHFAPKFRGDDMVAGAKGVLANLIPAEAEVESEEGRCYIRRIIPYRTEDDRIDGVVVTFTDITARKRAEEACVRARSACAGCSRSMSSACSSSTDQALSWTPTTCSSG
jgi:two-component system CheB/CheR fusion protein